MISRRSVFDHELPAFGAWSRRMFVASQEPLPDVLVHNFYRL
jgi:hypothetical protein